MNTEQVPGIFDSFNARSLKPAQVAQTFVPLLQYQRLIQRRHSVLVGPRGSGKTTLLKMLQPQALEAWSNPKAEFYRSQIDFTGVFIPTDLTWREQIHALGGGHLDSETLRLLSSATVTTHVLRSLVITIAYRCSKDNRTLTSFRRAHLNDIAETEIVSRIAAAWELAVPVPSLLALKHSLSVRMSQIQQLANQEAARGENGRKERLSTVGYLFLDFIQAGIVAIEQFDDVIGESDARWALMFDELELAPEWLQAQLIGALRSREDRLIFKLAMSPYSDGLPIMSNPLAAAPDQDFDPVSLWYAEKRSSYSFCTDLWYQILAERRLPRVDPKSALGRSSFETPSEEWKDTGTAYAPGRRLSKLFVNAAQRDASFRNYLLNNDVDPLKLHTISPDKRASLLRKVAPVLIVREFFLREGQAGKTARRSRKRALLYTGSDSMFAVSEGNPRWFISMIGRLLDHWDPRSNRVSDSVQASEMVHAAQRFAAMLGTIPTGELVGSRGLLGIIEHIADYFHARVVADAFTPEPPSTFDVDNRVPKAVAKALGQALNAGAIVYVPDDWSRLILDDLQSKRFRVSYLLAPLFGLPIRLGKEINLSSILEHPISQDTDVQLPLV